MKYVRKLKLVKAPAIQTGQRLFRCPVVVLTLNNGETVKRGCGRPGMSEFDAGLKCLYCGNYLYKKVPSLESLWFHFRWAREFWRVHHTYGREFVNGMPVTGKAEALPASCLSDLAESRPPRWFPYFLKSSDREFQDYMIHSQTG